MYSGTAKVVKQQLFGLSKDYSVIKKSYLEKYESILKGFKTFRTVDNYHKVNLATLKESPFKDSAFIMYPNHNPKPYFVKFSDSSINTSYIGLKEDSEYFNLLISEDKFSSGDNFEFQSKAASLILGTLSFKGSTHFPECLSLCVGAVKFLEAQKKNGSEVPEVFENFQFQLDKLYYSNLMLKNNTPFFSQFDPDSADVNPGIVYQKKMINFYDGFLAKLGVKVLFAGERGTRSDFIVRVNDKLIYGDAKILKLPLSLRPSSEGLEVGGFVDSSTNDFFVDEADLLRILLSSVKPNRSFKPNSCLFLTSDFIPSNNELLRIGACQNDINTKIVPILKSKYGESRVPDKIFTVFLGNSKASLEDDHFSNVLLHNVQFLNEFSSDTPYMNDLLLAAKN